MTAEFNITIPGAEIIKRLTDLETKLLDFAREQVTDKVLVNAHTDNIAGLIDRVDRLTAYVHRLDKRIDKLERAALSENENDRPQRDTSWHPYDWEVDRISGDRPHDDAVVVVMFRDGNVQFPTLAGAWNWDDRGDSTIIAWRYAKEGE